MTYDEIKTKVAEYLNRTDLTSQMDMFIDLTESDINKVIKHQDLIKRANAVAETQYTQLPSDWSRVINVELNTSDHTTLLQQSTESLDLKRTSIDNVSGRPEYFAITDNAIELCPTPDTNYELQLTYYANIPELSSTNTTNVVSDKFPDVYIYGCCKHASVFLMEDERVGMFQTLFDKALEEVRLQQERASFGVGSLIPRRKKYGKAKKQTYYFKN
jgi:hypothetical protein|tara:strand:- start:474 stop:1121 length:648 start_codon:yes stop_codon:yes gene_type:complete